MISSFRKASIVFAGITFCLALASATLVAEEQQKTYTIVTVDEMCGGCVKKITKRFEDEEHVAKVDCNIEKKTVTIVPREGVRLSAKAIWEIMEGISKTPVKLVSPEGTFTSKPK